MNRTGLSGNTLKIIAAICMLADHIGYILLPDAIFLRIIGRIAFPIFAFMIAEGCRYTKNKIRYFLCMAIFGTVMQLVYYAATGGTYANIFFTFSISILLIYALNLSTKVYIRFFAFFLVTAASYILCLFFEIDYGFWGCMLPVFASAYTKSRDSKYRLAAFTAGLIILSLSLGGVQPYCLLSLPFLMLYDGSRGKLKLKYFFYIFYPLHLAVLYGISML